MARRTKEANLSIPVHEMLRQSIIRKKSLLPATPIMWAISFKKTEEKTKHFHRNVVPFLNELEEVAE